MITSTVELGGLRRKFERLRKLDRRKVFKTARKPSKMDQREHIKAMVGPRGSWAPLAAATLERRTRKMKGRTRSKRRVLGRLPRAMVIRYDADRLTITHRAKWAGTHWKGARVGHGARLPARQFWFVSRKLKRELKKLFTAAMKAAWNNRTY